MSYEAPPILRLVERLLVELEEAVRRFPRYHKYTLGSELRTQAMRIACLSHRAGYDKTGCARSGPVIRAISAMPTACGCNRPFTAVTAG